jgi:hypothetical protein
MRKLLCRNCGNDQFYVVNTGGTLCTCGLRLTTRSHYRMEEKPPLSKEHQKTQADLIAKVSLLKREIDRCLDERDQAGFKKLSYELKVCQNYLETKMNDPKERWEYTQDKFFNH